MRNPSWTGCAGGAAKPLSMLLGGERTSVGWLTNDAWHLAFRYVPGTTETLYEEYFHCQDLGVQLAPIIERFRQSEMAKTGTLRALARCFVSLIPTTFVTIRQTVSYRRGDSQGSTSHHRYGDQHGSAQAFRLMAQSSR